MAITLVTLSLTSMTSSTVTINMETTNFSATAKVKVYASDKSTLKGTSAWQDIAPSGNYTFTISGTFPPGTYYAQAEDDNPSIISDYLEIVFDEPKAATQAQWESLASKIKDPSVYGATNTDTYYIAERTDTSTKMAIGIGSGGINHGIWSWTQGGWILKGDSDKVSLIDGARVLGGWYCAGHKSGTGTSLTLDLPNTNPWAIRIMASVEITSGTANWCNINAIDANGNILQHQRTYSSTTSSGVSVTNAAGDPLMVLPMYSTYQNAVGVAECRRSYSSNWRSWTWQSSGGNYTVFEGTSRQNNNTDIKSIRINHPGTDSYMSLEVWLKD